MGRKAESAVQIVWRRRGNLGAFGRVAGSGEKGSWQEVLGWVLGEEGEGEWRMRKETRKQGRKGISVERSSKRERRSE